MNRKLKISLMFIANIMLGSLGTYFWEAFIQLVFNQIPSIGGIIGFLSVIGVTALTVFLVMYIFQRKKRISRYFVHLTVHYDGKSKTPAFITNNRTKHAYWVSDTINYHVQRGEIPIHRHKKNQIQKYRDENKEITFHESDPLLSELGLRQRMDDSFTWTRPNIDRKLLDKLLGKELDDLKLVYVYPWYFYFVSTHGHDLPNRWLLFDSSAKEAFEPPNFINDLVDRNIIASQGLVAKPCESLKKFAKRYADGYEYNRRTFTKKMLLEKVKKIAEG